MDSGKDAHRSCTNSCAHTCNLRPTAHVQSHETAFWMLVVSTSSGSSSFSECIRIPRINNTFLRVMDTAARSLSTCAHLQQCLRRVQAVQRLVLHVRHDHLDFMRVEYLGLADPHAKIPHCIFTTLRKHCRPWSEPHMPQQTARQHGRLATRLEVELETHAVHAQLLDDAYDGFVCLQNQFLLPAQSLAQGQPQC